MSAVTSEAPNAVVAVPEIVITEPSPLIPKPTVTAAPVQEKAVTIREGDTSDPRKSPEKVETSNSLPEQTTSTSVPEQERDSSSEFSPAEDCIECVVPVPEVPAESEQAEATIESSETDPDEFRTYRCCHLRLGFQGAYEYIWNILESRYSIPFWLLAMALPVSAGIMGAVYMFNCPAADNLPNMLFMIGISLMAVFTFRICIILHRMIWVDENSRSMLQTMNMICLFVTSLFYITESATFWQMNPSTNPGDKDFCHPTLSTYAYWWNIAMAVFLIIIFMFPIA